MRKLIEAALYNTFGGSDSRNKEGFLSGYNYLPQSNENKFIFLLSFIIVEILILIFGKFLWNNVAIYLVPNLRPVTSIWQILGFSILIKLLTN